MSSAGSSDSEPRSYMTSPDSTPPPTPPTKPIQVIHQQFLRPNPRIPLTSFESTPHNLAWIAFSLGLVFATGAHALVNGVWNGANLSIRLGFYAMCWSFFHMMEFTITSMYCPTKLSVSSFLLNNGKMYIIAHTLSVTELILEAFLLPTSLITFKYSTGLLLIGMVSTIVGQYFRSMAMSTASSSFSHTIATTKLPSHRLITEGIYSYTRHPSYVGFWYWCLGLQLFCGNWICFLAFIAVLWKYFSSRIQIEEEYLVDFFGNDYVEYRKRVPSRLPFIP